MLAAEQPWSKGSFWSITPGFERFDVVVEPASAIPRSFFRTRALVFDRDGLHDQLPPAEPGPGPSPARVDELVRSFFHFSAMLEVVLVRQDWLLFREHLHVLGSLVHQLYVEANQPLPAMGLKQWRTKLTPEQEATLLALPTDARSLDEAIAAHLAHARAFLPTARLAGTWPDDLADAARRHLVDVLGVDDPYPEG